MVERSGRCTRRARSAQHVSVGAAILFFEPWAAQNDLWLALWAPIFAAAERCRKDQGPASLHWGAVLLRIARAMRPVRLDCCPASVPEAPRFHAVGGAHRLDARASMAAQALFRGCTRAERGSVVFLLGGVVMDIAALAERIVGRIDQARLDALRAFYELVFLPSVQSPWLLFAVVSLWFGTFVFVWRVGRVLAGEPGWQLLVMRTVGGLCALGLLLVAASFFVWGLVSWHAISEFFPDGSRDGIVNFFFDQKLRLLGGAGVGVLVGAAFVLWFGRVAEPAIARWLDIKAKKAGESGLSDVREPSSVKKITYDPLKYFDKALKNNSIFLGLDDEKKPVCVPVEKFNLSNIQICGPTRCGKGIQSAVVLYQKVALGDAVFVVDPKGDDWGPRILEDACKKYNKPFIYIDLNREQPPQFNLLKGCTTYDLVRLLEAGFELSDQGGDSDFYRVMEREAAQALAEHFGGQDVALAEISDRAGSILGDKAKDSKKLILNLAEVAQVRSVQTREGPALSDILASGGVVWVVGTEDDVAVQRLQRMVAIRIIQILRARGNQHPHATILFDEFSCLVSAPTVLSLKTIVGKGNANILLCHQSLGDLRDVPRDLDPEAVASQVIGNTKIRWLYGTSDPDTVEWICRLEGTKVVRRERGKSERNNQGAELVKAERYTDEVEIPFLHPNDIFHLPEGKAVVVGLGLARFANAAPIKTVERSIHVKPVTAVERWSDDLLSKPTEQSSQANNEDDLL
jgi:hypothetical protein